jgi:hypothetical protein
MKNLKLEVVEDMHPYNPREDDNLTKMVCFHGRYNLGDKHNYKHGNYDGWAEMEKVIIKEENVAIILPLYLFDHSGITISTKPFNCPFDSGRIGFVYITKQSIYKEYNTKRITKAIREKAIAVLEAEVKTYDKYISGDVWGYRITDENDSEVDSVWGYYDYTHAEMDGKNRLEYLLEN